ncbi:MAG: hypothetical protein IPL79_19875 [Myxococcales bacterium]|nr:hypothetical protein [Myxococcales bacterium]
MPYNSYKRETNAQGVPIYKLYGAEGDELTLPQGGAADRFVLTIPEREDMRLADNNATSGEMMSRADTPPPMGPPGPPADTRPPVAPPIPRGAPPMPAPAPRQDRSGKLNDDLAKLTRRDLTATQSASEKDTNVTLEGKAIDPALVDEERALRLGVARGEMRQIDERERGAALASYLEPKRAAAADELTAQTGALRQQSDARRMEAMQQIGREIDEENKKEGFWETRTEKQAIFAVLGGIAAAFSTPEVAAGYFDDLYAKWQDKKAKKLASLEKKKGLTGEYWDLYRRQLDDFEVRQLDRINRQIAGVASRGLPPREAAEFAAWFQKNQQNPAAGVAPQAVAAVRQETEQKVKALSTKKALTPKDKADLARLQGDIKALAALEGKVAARDVTRGPADASGMAAMQAGMSASQGPGGLRTAPAGAVPPRAPPPPAPVRPSMDPAVLRQLQEEERRTLQTLRGPRATKDIR